MLLGGWSFIEVMIETDSFRSAHRQWDDLASKARVTVPHARCREEFLQECRSGHFNSIVAVYRTFYSAEITGPFNEELVLALPRSIKFISHSGKSRGRTLVMLPKLAGCLIVLIPKYELMGA
jgi:hypothetical protein